MNTKICNKCKENKTYNEFAKNAHRKDGLQGQCRACKKISDANHYRKNKSAQIKRNHINRLKLRAEIDEFKRSKGCKYCSENDPCCLDFHHINSDNKDDNISNIINKGSKIKLWNEILKCEVVCSNCHRKIHKLFRNSTGRVPLS
mgnify:CR=1 FL=1